MMFLLIEMQEFDSCVVGKQVYPAKTHNYRGSSASDGGDETTRFILLHSGRNEMPSAGCRLERETVPPWSVGKSPLMV
jgi:hypothetical protein